MNTLVRTIRHIHPQEAAFWIFSIAIAATLAVYIYSICASVVHVVLRQELLLAHSMLDSRVGELETEYLSRKQEITKELATTYGLVTLTRTQFVARADTARALTIRDTTP